MYIPLTFEGALQKCLFATGGYEGYFISGSTEYKYHWFTGSAALTVQKGTIDNVKIYVIGGGGGGARGNITYGAGGGGGGGVNYVTNARLFQGTYNIQVGAGGNSGSVINDPGLNGGSSQFIGANLNILATGGNGAPAPNGGNVPGGTGGTPNGGNGGNGGTTTCTNGGSGITLTTSNNATYDYGCGGGGARNAVASSPVCLSCNSTIDGRGAAGTNKGNPGTIYYGMGGGGGNVNGVAGAGASGSVYIEYPINTYCLNNFNKTGSCGCEQVFFYAQPGNYNTQNITASFLYFPCNGSEFVSGSLYGYYSKTVCAVSNSWYNISSSFGNANGLVGGTGPQCVSQSIIPLTCSMESYVPTCTSSVLTIYTPSASVSNINTFTYVAKNETTKSVYTTTSSKLKYFCASTGSTAAINNIELYPQIRGGNFNNLYYGAICNDTQIVASWAGQPAGNGSTTYNYFQCNNGTIQTVTLTRPTTTFTGSVSSSVCKDWNTPAYFTRTGQIPSSETVTTGSSCIESYFSASACGCP